MLFASTPFIFQFLPAVLLAAAREYKAVHEAHREVADLLLDLDRSHEDFMQAADRVPADRWEPGKTTHRIVDGNTAHHYHEHADQIRAWRASRGL